MNYIVFDLEFNQYFDFGKRKTVLSSPCCPFEIIHLGAVKLDEDLNIVENFDSLVKPKIYTRLHPYVKKITGIEKDDLESARPFREVYREFVKLFREPAILGVWGNSDIKELIRNIEYHKLDTFPIPKEYIDIQHYANKHLNQSKGISVGLENAATLLNIPTELDFHNAFNDAYYTAEVFKRIYNDQIKPETYDFQSAAHSKNAVKTTLDVKKLIKHFEKKYEREMTDEEKSIIKHAYNLGHAKQFQKIK
jgi:inhibitor of KinA sporulation pathway (predicted exonuclease)